MVQGGSVMAVQARTIPTSFEQEELAKFLDSLIPYASEVAALTIRQHAANARNTADYLRAPCFTCATGGQ
jgi:hypothetical protein